MRKLDDMATVPVLKRDLRYLRSFGCEHVIHSGKPDEHCDKRDGERGGCCNSCWARRWAEEELDKETQ
jgi:hypothetical protein